MLGTARLQWADCSVNRRHNRYEDLFGTEAIRNVALLSHSGAGKTSLAEAMLFASGAINRLGHVDDGTSPEDGYALIEATAPLSELQRYATELRSMTQGRGSYTMDFSHYDPVPQHLAQKIADETKQQQSVAN